jgi:hypothetical protein
MSATNFCYFTDISNVGMNSFRLGHENIMPSWIFKFYSALCKGGKKMSPTFQIFVLRKTIGATRV